ncbi:DUF4174 domain-containing protein [Pedobacter sp. HMF7647]|uniref:DUF4174 domain-containing protein n=1 Tax=Hufsiella arboris TaxID=2695275 RepID=A0A7K1YFB1_9SPHI|nr:DUF4174 domain-containing protein [Hufsiella arboris]MXV53297.1 DUF4174 domain-containing protein [Hufsiella arboris]
MIIQFFAVAVILSISSFQQDKRQILLFAPSEENNTLKLQLAEMATNDAGFKERDLTTKTYYYKPENEAIFKKYKVGGKGYQFVLIGKDGLEKYRSEKLVSNQKLFSLIDEMPMRKQEMKKE